MDRSSPIKAAIHSVIALIFALGLTGIASAQNRPPLRNETVVDLNLVLAVDASGSVDNSRFALQNQGYAAAFRNPRVLAAIRAGDQRAIAVSMVQWTGPTLHVVVVPWTLVNDQRSAVGLATVIERTPRQIFGGGTSLSGAIDYGVIMLTASPYRGTRRIIDISGDGSNNRGRPAEQARNEAVKMGIRINGLPIMTLEPDLDQYYRQSVIGGPGAFVIPARNYDQFADAILRKLIAEISQDNHRASKLAVNKQPYEPFCLSGRFLSC
jgi:Protein of unknown function (DUF1194)